jgi:hypothetical protein
MEKVFKTAHIRFLEQQIAKGNISYSKMVELLNKIAHNYYVVSKNCNLQNVTNCNFKTVVALYEDVNSKLAVSEQILPVHKGDKMTIDDTCYEVDYVDYNFDKAIFEIVVTDDS